MHYLEIGRVVAILDPSGPEGETEYGLIFFAAPEGTELKASLPIGDTTWLDDINSRHMTLTLLIRADDDEVTKDFAIGMKIADGKGIARIRAVHD